MALTKVSGPLLNSGNHNLGNYVINNITGAAATFTSLDCSNIDLSADDLKIVGIITNSVLTPGTVVWVGTGNTLTESDNLTWDNTNVRLKNLGITSTKALNVTGISTFHGDIALEAAGANRISMRHTSGGNAVIKNPTAANLSFGTNDQDNELTIRNGGNVGIGSTIPMFALEVVSNEASGYIASFRQHHPSNSAQLILHSPADNNIRPTSIDFAQGGTVKWSIGQAYASASSQAFHIATSPLQSGMHGSRVVVTTAGNVGIGSSVPTYKVDVSGITRITNDADNTATDMGNSGALSLHNTQDAKGTFIDFVAESANGTAGMSAKIGGWNTHAGSGYSGELTFSTRDGSNMLERLRISSSGKIGIGGIQPKGQLDIDASGINAAGDFDDPNDYAIVIRNSPTSNEGNGIAFTNDDAQHVGGAIIHIDKGSNNLGDLAFYTAATSSNPEERLRIDSSGNTTIKTGNVGVHTATLTDNRLVGPASGISSFRGAYLADGMMVFNNTLNNSEGYYIGAGLNALNAGPVTLLTEMTIDGTWVIV